MKILEINTERGWRGGEKQTLLTAQGLADLGEQVTLLCRTGSKLYEKGKALDLIVDTGSGFWTFLWFLILHGRRYDVIHVHTAKDQTLAVITKWIHRRPIVYSRRVEFLPHGNLTRLKYRQTDQVVAISQAVRAVIEPFVNRAVPIIPDAVSLRKLNRNRVLFFLKERNLEARFFAGTMAALTPEKDPFTMLNAIKRLATERDDFIFLHFGDGHLRKEMEARIAEAALQNRYILLGQVEEVEDFFSILSVYAMSSEREGLGSTVLEAMGYGVPVVSTDAGGLKETVASFGLLSPIGDAETLALNLEFALTHLETGEWKERQEKARNWVMEKYGLEKVSRQYLEVFRSDSKWIKADF